MANVYVDSTDRAQSKIQGNIWGTGVVPNPEFIESENTQDSIVFEPENRSARKQTTQKLNSTQKSPLIGSSKRRDGASRNSQSTQKSQITSRASTSGESQKSSRSRNRDHQSNSQSQSSALNTSRASISGSSQKLRGSRSREEQASTSGSRQRSSGSRSREEQASTSRSSQRSSGSRNSRDQQSSHRSKSISQYSDSGLFTQDPFFGSQSSSASSQLSVASTQQSSKRVASLSTQIIRKPAEKSKTHHLSSREKEEIQDSKRKALEGAFGTNNVFKNVTINMHFHYHGE